MSLIGTLAVNVIANIEKLTTQLSQGSQAVSDFAHAAEFELGRFTSIIMEAAAKADELSDSAARLQVSASQLQAWGAAAEASGGSAESLNVAIAKLNTILGEVRLGSEKAAEGIRTIGLDPVKIAAMSTADAFSAIADRIKAIHDPADRAAAAFEVFGKSGADMIPLFAQGGDGIADMSNKATELGQVLNDGVIAKAGELHDALARATAAGTNFAITVAAALSSTLAPALDAVSAKLGQYGHDLAYWADRNGLITLETTLRDSDEMKAMNEAQKAREAEIQAQLDEQERIKAAAQATKDIWADLEKQTRDVLRAEEDVRREAEEITKAARKPTEVYDDQVKRLEQLRDLGKITAETYERGVKDAAEKMKDAEEKIAEKAKGKKKDTERPDIESKAAGSQEAFAVWARAQNDMREGNAAADAAKETAKNTEKTVEVLKEMSEFQRLYLEAHARDEVMVVDF